jgi:ABC-type Na+ efflux pump permease subunit
MDTTTWIWIIVAIVVLLILIAVIAKLMGNKRQEVHRNRAGELREQAAAQATGVQQRDAEARETAARAQQAEAEAERSKAQADRLAAEAQDQQSTVQEYRDRHRETLTEADRLDPDVDTKSDDYTPPTERDAGYDTGYDPGHRADVDPDGTDSADSTDSTDTGSTRA